MAEAQLGVGPQFPPLLKAWQWGSILPAGWGADKYWLFTQNHKRLWWSSTSLNLPRQESLARIWLLRAGLRTGVSQSCFRPGLRLVGHPHLRSPLPAPPHHSPSPAPSPPRTPSHSPQFTTPLGLTQLRLRSAFPCRARWLLPCGQSPIRGTAWGSSKPGAAARWQ